MGWFSELESGMTSRRPAGCRSSGRIFKVAAPFEPAGDQPAAIAALADGIADGLPLPDSARHHRFRQEAPTIAWTIERAQRPTLVLAPNKSLAAQLASELRELFPENRVEYFVSYYDYYQPEAYIPSSDTYIEKDSSGERRDRPAAPTRPLPLCSHGVTTIVVASVSAIYGLGSPEEYETQLLVLAVGGRV